MNELECWKYVFEDLKQDKEAVLVIIIHRVGSAPNVPGAKMFVTHDKVMGTVGGGVSESTVLTRAKTILEHKVAKVEQLHLEHNEKAEHNKSGMICSGSQKFALVLLGKQHLTYIENLINSLEKARPGVLSIHSEGIKFKLGDTLASDISYTENDLFWEYKEYTGNQYRLFIIGGGHVSLALSRVVETLGFHITVIDDRTDLPTMKSNTFAHEKIVGSYEEILNLIPEGERIFVAIMTYGHISDEQVLENLIDKNFGYLGMMASKSKKQQVFSNLKDKGISTDQLENIHTPIGISINSNTPEEIAISIAAELIYIKNSNI